MLIPLKIPVIIRVRKAAWRFSVYTVNIPSFITDITLCREPSNLICIIKVRLDFMTDHVVRREINFMDIYPRKNWNLCCPDGYLKGMFF